ncbi:hypothetical protein LDENG_00117050 [Lucifuga dentata]|nr:hypothetical protein LDENG_00117050 [Lucifuga dentata]
MAKDVGPLSLTRLSAGRQRSGGAPLAFVFPSFLLHSLIFHALISLSAAVGSLAGIEYEYGISPNNGHSNGHNGSSRCGVLSDEAKATILHLRESLVRQKETILDQRETIRELTAKLTLCEGFGSHQSIGHHDNHHSNYHDNHHDDHHGHHGHHSSSSSHHGPSYHSSDHRYSHGSHQLDLHHRPSSSHSKHGPFSPQQTGKMLQTLKERLENLEARNSSSSYSSSLRDLLQRKINALEEQLHDYYRGHYDYGHHDDHHDDPGHNKLETVLSQMHHSNADHGSHKKPKSSGTFQLDFPMRTNYLYAKMKRSVDKEIFALTVCLWLKAGASPGIGTPFSYAVPGQANELVLMEWGSNPMQLLINDKAVTMPITLTDGKWHHMCMTWTTRDGLWEVYQDGVKKGSGQNLSAWHPIKPGGVFIMGQEQDTMGGRFDVSQSFMGDMEDLQFWSRVLTPNEIHSQATCRDHLASDIMSWSEEAVELHGGLAKYPFVPCH